MRAWQTFWSVSLLVAGGSFTLITVVVAIKGFQDLRDLFCRLRHQEDDQE
jgi:hypothetical protein